MHFDFHFSAIQILWTLTLAALLVLLVVLFGRDRARRFPCFTAAVATMAFRLIVNHMLLSRLPMVVASATYLVLVDLAQILSLLVVLELARRAFAGAKRRSWIVVTTILLAVAATVPVLWGPWPAWKTLSAASIGSALRLMQLFAQKTELFASTLAVLVGLLIVVAGRRFAAGWRSHAQQIAIGFSTASQLIAMHTTIHDQADYARVIGLLEKLTNANNALYVAVLVWWIVWLWIDEPGARSESVPAEASETTVLETPAASPDSATTPAETTGN
jgi:hypothetical protein